MTWVLWGVYLIAAVLFIFGLKAMSSPKTAAAGIKWAGVGMVPDRTCPSILYLRRLRR